MSSEAPAHSSPICVGCLFGNVPFKMKYLAPWWSWVVLRWLSSWWRPLYCLPPSSQPLKRESEIGKELAWRGLGHFNSCLFSALEKLNVWKWFRLSFYLAANPIADHHLCGCNKDHESYFSKLMIKQMTHTFNENRLSMMKSLFLFSFNSSSSPQAPSKHQTVLSANIHRFDPESNILWRILEFSTADYRVGRGLELWKGQRRVYSSSSSSLFSYLWRMSCKGGNFKSW